MSAAAVLPTLPVEDLHAPFDDPGWRADLSGLAEHNRQGWQRWAAECELIARLAAQVPAETGLVRESTAWRSFLREVAVARRCSDQAAGKEVFLAVALVQSHPVTLRLLKSGLLPAFNARVLIEECAPVDAAVIAAVEAELAERACRLTPSRIRAEVRRIELRHDADAAAARAGKAASARGVRLVGERDDQASLILTGPVLVLSQFYETVTAAARAARAAGDPRGLDALRFDLALDLPLDTSQALDATGLPDPAPAPADPAPADPAEVDADELGADKLGADKGQGWRPLWLGDRRRLRPVQILIHLPVTTALGLDNEPGWLPGYGWVSAPQCRQWLTIAELRQVCVGADGFVLDSADRVVRPQPTPAGARQALLDMVADPGRITDKTWQSQPQHDPSPALAGFLDLRDGYCDGPTGTAVPAARCHADHELPYPQGPTAAWNLRARAGRTHLLKHHGWTPVRTANSTLWFSPAGQVVDIPHRNQAPPELDPDAHLPDPDQLHTIDADYLRPPGPDDHPPWHGPPPNDRIPDLDNPPF
jgi:hypothetical protein